jgi:hypothetical protein
MSEELTELKKISKILTMVNAKTIENELAKYATTDERKRIWVLIDGKRMSKDIATSSGVTRRAVDLFLKSLETAELVESPWGKPPKRILDFVPAPWLNLIKPEEVKPEETSQKEAGETNEPNK